MNFFNMIKAGMDPNSFGGSMLTRMGASGVGGMPGQDMMGNRRPPQQPGMDQMSEGDMRSMSGPASQQPSAPPPMYAPPGAPDMTAAGMAGGQPGGPHEMKKGGLMEFIKMMAGGGA